MKKVLLIVVMLLLAVPAMAAITISAVKEGTPVAGPNDQQIQTIRIEYAIDGCDVRAFGLDINCAAGVSFWNVRDFNVGESNGAATGGKSGYGIFPSRFRDFVNPVGPNEPNWKNTNYLPLVAWNEPGSTSTGYGFPKMIVEMGTLFLGDANKPALTGTLFRFDVNSEHSCGDNILAISLDTLRGGVVDANAYSVSAAGITFNGTTITWKSCCSTPANEVGQPKATAEGVWTTAGYTNLQGTAVVGCPVGNILTNDQNCIALTDPLKYTYSVAIAAPASCTVPATDADGNYAVSWAAVTGATSYKLESSAPASGTTIFPLWVQIYSGTATTYTEKVGGGTWSYRVTANNACSSSTATAGGNTCVVANCLIGGVAGTSENSDWVKWRYPACWCYSRQCRGDINGKTTGTPVASNDLTLFTAAFGKNNALLAAVPNGLCADLNHKATGTRVASNDLTVFTTYFGKATASVPLCNVAPLTTGPYNYFTTP